MQPVCAQLVCLRYWVRMERQGLHGLCEDAGMPLQTAEGSLSKEGHPEDDQELCIVCWEKLREVIFCHCMHMVHFLPCSPPPRMRARQPDVAMLLAHQRQHDVTDCLADNC